MRIGLYLNHLDEEYQISIYKGIKAQALKMGVDLLCIQGETLYKAQTFSPLLLPSKNFLQVDGVLLLSSVILNHTDLMFLPDLTKTFRDTPCISIGNRLFDFPSIIIKSRHSMEQLMDHLIFHHGYRRFLYMGGPVEHRDNMVREHVFRRFINTCQEKFPHISGRVVNGGFHEVSGMHIVNQYIKEHPTGYLDAIVAANDNMAIGALKALRTQSDPRWRDCAVTGFDDIPQGRHEVPSITTVHQPLAELGKLAVEALMNAMEGQKIPQVIHVDSHVCIRHSCGCTGEEETEHSDPTVDDLRNHLSHIQYQAIKSEQNMRNLSYLGQSLTAVDSLKFLLYELNYFLNNINNQRYYLLLYPEHSINIPSEARLIFKREEGKETLYLDDTKNINLKEFFDSQLYANALEPESLSVYHLISGNEKIGLVIYEAEDYTHPHMCSSSVFVANSIKRLQIMTDEKERSRLLEQQVALRTEDLVKINKKLKEEARQRIAVEAEVLRISELERQRFSMDLHDDICQRLAGISMYSKSISSLDALQDLSFMIDETLQRTRRYAHDSFPMEIDSLGLNEALRRLCDTTEKQTGTPCNYSWELDLESPFSKEEDINIYRIIQEALSNIIRHSGASQADVRLNREGDAIFLRVEDDGIGTLSDEKKSPKQSLRSKRGIGLGRRSMEYRAHQLNAEYSCRSEENKGTLIELRIPLDKSNNESPL